MPQHEAIPTDSQVNSITHRPMNVRGHPKHQDKQIRQPETQLLALQQLAGNRAVSSLLRSARRPPTGNPGVQRCGPVPCDCPPEERAAKEQALPGTVQPSASPEAPTVQRAQEDCCQEAYPRAIPIRWPSPNWHPGIGDPGAENIAHDLPDDPLLIKRGSDFYDEKKPEIGRYDRIISNSPFNLTRPAGWPIHHKVPLFVGGWGDDAGAAGEYNADGRTLVPPNLVVLAPGSHNAWHSVLTRQPSGPRPGQGPSGNTPDGQQFCVMDLMPGNCEPRPVPVPVPVPVTPVDWETVKKRIREALPWAVATVAIAGLVACFATGICELATVIALVGAGAAVVIVGILREAGISVA